MEKELTIPTGDGHRIYCLLNYRGRLPRQAVIFVHGLTGHSNEQAIYNGTHYLVSRGFAAIRYDQYGDRPRQRRFPRVTVKIQAADLARVVSKARRMFEKVFVVGHSLGAQTILLTDTARLDAIVLWDPSSELDKRAPTFAKLDPRLNAYVIHWSVPIIWGKSMYREIMRLPDTKSLIAGVQAPIKIIAAGGFSLLAGARQAYRSAPEPKEWAVIPGAGHCFNEEGAAERLFLETYRWLKRFR